MQTVWDNFTDWLRKPFDSDMDTLHWFLFVLLLIVIMTFWRVLLIHITEA